ncbi:MAG: radical SAM/SPASM domain-containing protein [Candidatus Omnitrophica bacterium]|nr:radical SAM/SPASM domain-containing protein [Candidatus Omnitrophota bacterium]
MRFYPEEVLFCPTAACNLRCAHCVTPKSPALLSARPAVRFLRGCRKLGIERVGFTGGEPFLALGLVCRITREAVRAGMVFDRIMTNASWFKDTGELRSSLRRLFEAGYDGSICVSVDAFHRQDLKKAVLFIKEAASLWNRRDMVSVASVTGAEDARTKQKLKKLARMLKARLTAYNTGHCRIKSNGLFVRVNRIDLSPVGKARRLKDPWGGRWFREDFCRGPGNVFFVMPDGSVKPCCGYATERPELTIGNIKRDTARGLMKNVRANRFVLTVFGSGLSALRKRLEARGTRFPGKTTSHCYFCHYVLAKIPKRALEKCLD